jgi:hypothetical protein
LKRQLVVAFRTRPASASSDGPYLKRARAVCAHAEALGGQLVAWSAVSFALAFSLDSLEEAIILATSVRDAEPSSDGGWACAIAEGELDALSPEGQRMHLAWGEALTTALSLAHVATLGEALIAEDLAAVKAGELALQGMRMGTDRGHFVWGWRLRLAQPWARGGPPEAHHPHEAYPPAPGADTQPRGGGASARHLLASALRQFEGQRAHEALLTTLEALALARRSEAAYAERACEALLSKLYASCGCREAALTLRDLATR